MGAVLVVVGLGVLMSESQGRLDAADRSIEFMPGQDELSGGESDGMLNYLRFSALVQSLTLGTDVPTYEVRQMDDEGGYSIEERHQRVVYSMTPTWHLVPTVVLAFAGLSLMLGALFIGAARWRRRHIERLRN